MSLTPRAVVVHRRTEFEELLVRHGTARQAEFFLRSRDRSIDEVIDRHDGLQQCLTQVGNAIPADWRRGRVERADLDRFRFDAGDVVVAVGQDGLVANVAKYLDGQPVIGVNAAPGVNPGVLVRHDAGSVRSLLAAVQRGTASVLARTMVRASTDDGQHLDALNEIYLGHPSHQSARYLIRPAGGPRSCSPRPGSSAGREPAPPAGVAASGRSAAPRSSSPPRRHRPSSGSSERRGRHR